MSFQSIVTAQTGASVNKKDGVAILKKTAVMTALSVQPPFPIITGFDEQPLEDGYMPRLQVGVIYK